MPPKNGMMAKLSNIKSSAQSAARKFLKAEEYPLASTGASEGLAGTDTTASGSGRQPDSAEVQCEESPSSFGQEIVHNHLPPPRRLQDRVVKFTEALTAKVIDLEKLRSLAREGVPDNDGLRALTWKASKPPLHLVPSSPPFP